MAVRTSPDEVKQIMDNCTLGNEVINSYIKTANLVVTEIFSTDTDTSAAMLVEIEKWYTAHMIASTRWRVATRQKLGEAEIEYAGKFGEDLSSTPYGQMLKTIDTSGKMSKMGKKAVSVYAITSFDS
jgi:hypothetical protein